VNRVRNFRIIAQTGFTGFVHNDNRTGGAYSITAGSWDTGFSVPAFGATDSWVCFTEPFAFPSYSAIPDMVSWSVPTYLHHAQIPDILDGGVGWSPDPAGPFFPTAGQQLLGQFVVSSAAQICLSADLSGYSGGFSAGSASGGPFGYATTAFFDFNGDCVPAPGAIALLGFAGFARRRTR